jgi:hypothetical protein
VNKAEAVVSGVGDDVLDGRVEMPPHAASVVRPTAAASPKDVARKRPEACIVRLWLLLHPPSGWGSRAMPAAVPSIVSGGL